MSIDSRRIMGSSLRLMQSKAVILGGEGEGGNIGILSSAGERGEERRGGKRLVRYGNAEPRICPSLG